MTAPPAKASISGTPSRATANAGFGVLWDYLTGLLGMTGNAPDARAALGLPNAGSISGVRNLLINGNFAINQRGYVSAAATSGANQYTLDRWRVVTSGQNLAFSASGNGNEVTAPAGGLEQVIEGASIEGGTYVINWSGTATATVGGVSRAKGDAFTLTENSNVTVRFSSGTVSNAQIERGSVSTPFEQRPYGLELSLCQRYCFVAPAGWVGGFDWAASTAAAYVHSIGYFPVAMRAAPTPSSVAWTLTSSNTPSQASISATHVAYEAQATGAGKNGFTINAGAVFSAEL